MLASYAYVRLDAQKSLQTCMHISLDFLDVTYFPGASGGRRIAPPRHLLSRQSPARTIATGDRLTVYSERGYLLRWLGDSGKAAIDRLLQISIYLFSNFQSLKLLRIELQPSLAVISRLVLNLSLHSVIVRFRMSAHVLIFVFIEDKFRGK